MKDYEIHIIGDKQNKNYSKKDMYNAMKAMEAYGGSILPDQHVEDQFEPWWDTMYIDFQIGEHIVTLHWEHYSGVHLLSKTADESVLSAMWEGIKPLIK